MGATPSCSCFAGDGVADFEKIHSCTANGVIPVTKYISKSTVLTVVHADIAGPIVSGYICVPTRAVDDDGLPHALEHLIFFGSKNYPYAGILDRIANKCLASGTDAWTDVDHTCFTLSTVRNEGFCQLLPIFMDHILYPLLTDAAFKTEVYHVGGRGNDAGVIYSELLALENTSYGRATDALFKELYPSCSGYRYNVAGKLSNLRDSTNNEKVKAFHKKFYNPRNICVIVCGNVDLNRIFRCRYSVLGKTKSAAPASMGKSTIDPTVVKPWLSEENEVIPDISASVEKTVFFPSKDEDDGCFVTVGFLGPSVVTNDMKDTYALFLLLNFLTKSVCAPLQKGLVEQKLSGNLTTSLDFNAVEFSRTAFIFELDNVAAQDKDKVLKELRKCLQKQLRTFDKERMDDVIRSSLHAELSITESAPHRIVSEAVIRDFLYGNNDLNLFKKRLNRIKSFESLLHERVSYWTRLIEEKILSANWVAIFAEPSTSLMKKLADQEQSRILLRTQLLGTSGLYKCMQELDAAILQNNCPIPKKVLRKVKVSSSMRPIQHHRITRIKNPTWVSTTDFPATLCLDDIFTNFIYVGLLMDTSKLQDQFRPYLTLFKEALLRSPIRRSSDSDSTKTLISFEDVCASRDTDLQLCGLYLGLELDVPQVGGSNSAASKFACGSYSHILALGLQMELDKVEEGMLWINKILWGTHWTMESIQMAANRMIGDVLTLRGEGSWISHTILKHLIYKENSNVVNNSIITQYKALQDFGANSGSEKKLVTAFASILKVITNPSNISLHIAADMQKLVLYHYQCSYRLIINTITTPVVVS